MGDVGDFFKDTKEFRSELARNRKEKNLKNAILILNDNNISYEIKNDGIHFIVEGEFDFYPTTGKFISRKNKKSGRGIRNLLKKLGRR